MKNFEVSYRFGAGRYIQTENALDSCGSVIKRFGKMIYIIGGPTALGIVNDRMVKSLDRTGTSYQMEVYSGFPSQEKIRNLEEAVKVSGADVIVGVGGGRIMDLAKATAEKLEIPVILIPTSAATCAAFSPLSVLYTEEGKSDCVWHLSDEVSAVIVDEQVMLSQSPRLLAAGILDAQAKYIEIETLSPYELNEDTPIDQNLAYYMAEYTYKVLNRIGGKAVEDLKIGRWSKELHETIYINIAITGVISAVMRGKGQTAMAHALNNACRRLFLDDVKPWLHGEVVAIGMIAQLIFNDQDDRTEEVRKNLKKYGFPDSLTEIGIDVSDVNMNALVEMLQDYGFAIHDAEHKKLLAKAIWGIKE